MVNLPNAPVSPSAVSPEPTAEKRSHSQFDMSVDKENIVGSYSVHSQKRMKHARHGLPLTMQGNFDPQTYQSQPPPPFTFAPQNHLLWRGEPLVSPSYPNGPPTDMWPQDTYIRSPVPGSDPSEQQQHHHQQHQQQPQRSYHNTHLAPMVQSHASGHSALPSPTIDSPTNFPTHPHTMHTHPHHQSQQQQQPQQAYYPRSAAGQSYMQQQQIEYLQQHAQESQFNYGAPYLAEATWEGTYSGPAA